MTNMVTQSENIKFTLNRDEEFNINIYYEYHSNSLPYQKTLNLLYRVQEAPATILLNDFLSDYIDKVLLNGFLQIQAKEVYCPKIIIKTKLSQISYKLSSNIRGLLNAPIRGPFTIYKFETHKRSGRNFSFDIFGVPSNVKAKNISKFEEVLVNQLVLKKTNCTLELIDIHSYSSNTILNTIGLSTIGQTSQMSLNWGKFENQKD